MAPVFFVMAIMGCGDGAGACEAARTLPARYATAAQCQAALPQALADNTDVPFPTITAACRAAPKSLASKDVKGKPKG